jgi:hypothetical protein
MLDLAKISLDLLTLGSPSMRIYGGEGPKYGPEWEAGLVLRCMLVPGLSWRRTDFEVSMRKEIPGLRTQRYTN